MAHRRMGIRAMGGRYGRVLAALAVDVVLMLGLIVVRLEVLIRDRPCRRDSAVMPDLSKVFLAQPEQRGAVELSVSAHVVIGVGMEVLAVTILPLFLRLIFPLKINGSGAPVVFLTRDVITPFEQQNLLSGWREF